MVWSDQPRGQGEDRPGCLDAIVLTRMALGILFWPMAAIIGAGAVVAFGILLLISYPLPAIGTAVALAVVATAAGRWFRARRRPPAE